MRSIPRAQEIYRHFKGNLYQIISIAEHTETEESLVVYQAMYGEFKVYARPLAMFLSKVDKEKYPDAKQEYRFQLLEVTQKKCEKEVWPKEEVLPIAEEGVSEEVGEEELPELDPMLMEFLEADTYEKRINILTGMQYKITNEMLSTMAVVCDIELEDGDVESRYQSLKNCLMTLDKYEISRT